MWVAGFYGFCWFTFADCVFEVCFVVILCFGLIAGFDFELAVWFGVTVICLFTY